MGITRELVELCHSLAYSFGKRNYPYSANLRLQPGGQWIVESEGEN